MSAPHLTSFVFPHIHMALLSSSQAIIQARDAHLRHRRAVNEKVASCFPTCCWQVSEPGAHWFMMASSTASHVVLAFWAFFCGCGWLPLRREPFLVFLFFKDIDIWLLCVVLGRAGRMSQRAVMCDGRWRRWYWACCIRGCRMILKTGLNRFQIRRGFYHNTAPQLLKFPMPNSQWNYDNFA